MHDYIDWADPWVVATLRGLWETPPDRVPQNQSVQFISLANTRLILISRYEPAGWRLVVETETGMKLPSLHQSIQSTSVSQSISLHQSLSPSISQSISVWQSLSLSVYISLSVYQSLSLSVSQSTFHLSFFPSIALPNHLLALSSFSPSSWSCPVACQ